MEDLITQEQFEELYNDKSKDTKFIVYFTAAWCGPCKALDTHAIAAVAKARGIRIFKCDCVTNEYTVGYCGVTSFPTFQYLMPRKPLSQVKSNQTQEVIAWINSL
jgi:thioredoxin-like negative regulator of GroEL